MKKSQAFTLAFVAGVALAACSGGGGSSPNAPACVKPSPPQLLYPVPGTTMVPDNVELLIYASNGQSDTITLFNSGTASVATTPTSLPSPLPTPIASPSNPSAQVVAVTFPTLAPESIYEVRYALPANCNPPVASFGFFQTQ